MHWHGIASNWNASHFVSGKPNFCNLWTKPGWVHCTLLEFRCAMYLFAIWSFDVHWLGPFANFLLTSFGKLLPVSPGHDPFQIPNARQIALQCRRLLKEVPLSSKGIRNCFAIRPEITKSMQTPCPYCLPVSICSMQWPRISSSQDVHKTKTWKNAGVILGNKVQCHPALSQVFHAKTWNTMGFILLMLSSKLGGSTLRQHMLKWHNKIKFKNTHSSAKFSMWKSGTLWILMCYFTIPMLSSKWGFSAKTENVEMAPHKKFKSTHA